MCPESAPFTADNKLCFPCFSLTPLYNTTAKLCSQCQSPLVFNSTSHRCFKVNYLTNLTAAGLLEDGNYTIPNVKVQQDNIRKDSNSSYVDCPLDKPYGEATACVSCLEADAHFNLKTLSCQKCGPSTKYWPAAHSCKPITYANNFQANSTLFVQDSNHTIQA